MNLTKHWAGQLDDYVIDLAWSPDGVRLAAGSASGPILIFDSAKGERLHKLPGHDSGTNALAWKPLMVGRSVPAEPRSPAAQPEASPYLLTSGGQDGAVKFWDAAAGQHIATAALGNAWIEHLAWRPIQMPDVRAQMSDAITADSPPPSDIRHLTSGICLAAASGRQRVFLNPDASLRHTFKPAPKTISALAWQPQGSCVAVAYFGGACLWDADDFIAQKEFAYANGIHALAWSPDGKWLVSGNQDPSVHLWIPESSAEFHMSGYEGKVRQLSFEHTSRWLATSGGRDACVWDCSGDGPEGRAPTMLPHDAPICAVAFQQNHGLLATASQDGVLHLWSPERTQPLRATVRMPVATAKIAWSPDDQFLAVGAENGAVFVLHCTS
ncbi:MAG: WD40 repeat domain-containing protein [Verrucomicrobiota bacterium]|nr:WD40 repeat domain-containing protein [Verrucomicrobiota bacterium]